MHNIITKDIAVTGPRSQFLYGPDPNHKGYLSMVTQLIDLLVYLPYQVDKLYNGMATGLDMMMALAVINFNAAYNQDIKLICCIPGLNQTRYFSNEELRVYRYILSKIPDEQIIYVSNKSCDPRVLKKRNQFMIDRADELLSFWDFERYRSGTYSAMCYAKKRKVPVLNTHPKHMDDRSYWFIPQ